MEVKSLDEVLRESFLACKTIDEKFLKLLDLISSQTKLIDIILNNLSPDTVSKILKQAGFKEFFN